MLYDKRTDMEPGVRYQIPRQSKKIMKIRRSKTKNGRLLVRNYSGQCKETKANTSRTSTIRLFSEMKR